jgi:hypothetical protein
LQEGLSVNLVQAGNRTPLEAITLETILLLTFGAACFGLGYAVRAHRSRVRRRKAKATWDGDRPPADQADR